MASSINRLKQLIHETHSRSLWQVLGIYVVSGWVVFEVLQTVAEGLGVLVTGLLMAVAWSVCERRSTPVHWKRHQPGRARWT